MNVIEKAARVKEYYDTIVSPTIVHGSTRIIGIDKTGNCLVFANSHVAMDNIQANDDINIYECKRVSSGTHIEFLR